MFTGGAGGGPEGPRGAQRGSWEGGQAPADLGGPRLSDGRWRLHRAAGIKPSTWEAAVTEEEEEVEVPAGVFLTHRVAVVIRCLCGVRLERPAA